MSYTDFSICKRRLQFLVAYEWVTPYSCSALKQNPVSHQICGKSQGTELQEFSYETFLKSELGKQGKKYY